MNRAGWMVAMACWTVASGCYQSNEPGQSGLDVGERVDRLADPERAQLCDWGVAIGAVSGAETDCGAEIIEAPTPSECAQGLADLAAAGSTCGITVGAVETCWLAMADDPCVGFHADVCQPPPGCD